MKKPVKIILAILAAGLAAYAYLQWMYQRAQGETQAIAVEFVTMLSRNWDIKTLESIAHPALLEEAKKQKKVLPDHLKIYSKLGQLKEPAHCSMLGAHHNTEKDKLYDLVQYSCQAKYTAGDADIYLVLRNDTPDNTWRLLGLNIDSPIFSQTPKK